MKTTLLPLAACGMLCGACDVGSDPPRERILFHFTMLGDGTGEQDFRAATNDPVIIAEARAQLAMQPQERQLFIIGDIERGNGGHNLDWAWHFVPDQWSLAEFAIELCDGNAVLVNQDIDYWVDTVGQFCPWGARLGSEVGVTR